MKKIKNIYLSFSISILCFFCSCSSNSENKYNIIAEFADIKYDTAILGFIPESNRNNELYDTVIIDNGKLNYYFDAKELHEGMIIPFSLMHLTRQGERRPLPASRIRFYINNGDNINLNVQVQDSCVSYTATGNTLSEQIAIERGEKRQIFKEGIRIFKRYHAQPENQENEKTYWKNRGINDSLYFLHSVDFIEKHPDYEYSARLWLETTKEKDTALRLYNSLHPSVKNSFFGKFCANVVNNWTLTKPGTELPNFSASTLSKDSFELKSLRGKYVVLDFWGSWCAPCIVEVPKLKAVQEKWKDKLSIVGLICNDKRDMVENAVKKHSIDWIQLYSESNEFPFVFGIKEYPTKVLLDPAGNVVKFYDSSSDASMFDEIDSLIQSGKFN